MRLQQYSSSVEYRPGKKNEEANYLSRHPLNGLKRPLVMPLSGSILLLFDSQGRYNLRSNKLRRVQQLSSLDNTPAVYIKKYQRKLFIGEQLAAKSLAKYQSMAKAMEIRFTGLYYTSKLSKCLILCMNTIILLWCHWILFRLSSHWQRSSQTLGRRKLRR